MPEATAQPPQTVAPTTTDASALPSFDPKTAERLQDPYPSFHLYRETDPVHWGVPALAGYAGAWYLFRHSDVVSALRDPRLGKARREVHYEGQEAPPEAPPVPAAAKPFFELAKRFLVHQDPPDHRRIRRLMSKAFTPRAVSEMRPRIEELCHELLDDAGDEMEFISEFAFPLPVAVIAEMLGLPKEARGLLSDWSRAFQEVDVRTPQEVWERAGRAAVEAREYIGDFIERRRREPKDDLISAMIAAEQEGDSLSHDELVANALFLFIAGAGFETTTGLIGNGLNCLLQHPDQWRELIEDGSRIRPAVEECLRYESPIQITNRTAHEELEIGGREIRVGESVLAVIASANRDPEVFDEPDRFSIHREPNPHHAFGLGIHYCLGGPLATLEAEVAFEVLTRRMPGLELAGEAEWSDNAAIRVLRSLPVMEVR